MRADIDVACTLGLYEQSQFKRAINVFVFYNKQKFNTTHSSLARSDYSFACLAYCFDTIRPWRLTGFRIIMMQLNR